MADGLVIAVWTYSSGVQYTLWSFQGKITRNLAGVPRKKPWHMSGNSGKDISVRALRNMSSRFMKPTGTGRTERDA